ncbi:MAG: DUF5683 domain-containing protein [Dysgonomonas sp.]|nr:DUF5683 domain-containing protein [Dysgonomonas sp.]
MRKKLIIVLWLVVLGGFITLHAQEVLLPQDSTQLDRTLRNKADTVQPLIGADKIVLEDSVIFNKPEFKPDSKKAVIYSAIFPGLGQLYNRKYWKLPIVYGGVLGLTYAITWNGNTYNDYNGAYRDLVLGVGESYLDVIPRDKDEILGNKDYWVSSLRKKKDFYRRNRDLAIIVAVGVYALCMIDAYVDAQLYDFDMSPDLSMSVAPVFMAPTSYSKATIGIQLNVTF